MGIYPDAQGQLISTVPGRILPNLEPIQDFMVVLITCKNDKDPIKNGGNIFPIINLWELSAAMETMDLI